MSLECVTSSVKTSNIFFHIVMDILSYICFQEPIKEAGILEGRNGIKETCLQVIHVSPVLFYSLHCVGDGVLIGN
jgi:hypothetical protein